MIIAARFNGPPGSGNGGYSAGLLAGELAAALPDPPDGIEVTLRRPPPLDTELVIRREGVAIVDEANALIVDGEPGDALDRMTVGIVRAFDGAELVAEATVEVVDDGEVVPGVAYDAAVFAARSYAGLVAHPFPTCFVCGPDRPAGDGLDLRPGRLGDGRTATPFIVPSDVGPALVWACLDCPGGWAVPQETRPYVLGRIAARIDALPVAGDHCVVMGALVREDGRKAFTRSTLYSPTGELLATARATWIAVV